MSMLKKTHHCNCRKTKCLKLYCECFAIGELCDQSCSCHDCSNICESYHRSNKIEQILNKDPEAFNSILASSEKKVRKHFLEEKK